jgi:hypothetical protein
MSYEDFKARWRGWMGQPGEAGIFYVAELASGRIVDFASGGHRREEGYPEYEGELYAAYLLRMHEDQLIWPRDRFRSFLCAALRASRPTRLVPTSFLAKLA